MMNNLEIEEMNPGKVPYVAPCVEVYECKVEAGYQATQQLMYNREEFHEITDSTGQNFHGEWW